MKLETVKQAIGSIGENTILISVVLKMCIENMSEKWMKWLAKP
mgnify:CR=1 FL=1|jgi:hypothetical protein